MNKRKVVIDLGVDRKLMLKVNNLEEEVDFDVERLVRIDMNNIHAEIVTFPIIINDFGMLLADLNHKVNKAKIDLEIMEAELASKIRDEYREEHKKELSNEKTAEAVCLQATWKAIKMKHINAVRNYEYINAIYWSLKSKDDKLNKISSSLQAGDIEENLSNSRLKKMHYIEMKSFDSQL